MKLLLVWLQQFERFVLDSARRLPRSGMSRSRRLVYGGLSLIILSAIPILAQPGPVSIRPDCFQFFTFTATGNSNLFDNRSAGCPYFAITYTSNGFTGVSLVVQVAPDAGGTPGTFATYTANSGINPNTSTTQAFSTFSGYFPWLRVQLTSIIGSGSIQGIIYGWRTPGDVIANGGTTGGCVGTAATPCIVAGPNATGTTPTQPPVLTAGVDNTNGFLRTIGVDSTGTVHVNVANIGVVPNLYTPFACLNQVFVNLAASGNAQQIAASGATQIRICDMHLSTTAPETIQITTGTGVNCAVGNVVIDAYQSTSAFTFDGGATAALVGAASQALCVNPSANTTLTGVIIYAQF